MPPKETETPPEEAGSARTSPPATEAAKQKPKLSHAERERLEQERASRVEDRRQRKELKEKDTAEKRQHALQAAAAFCGPPPERRAWGHGYFGQKEFLEHVVDDPDSMEIVDCSDPRLKLPPHCWVLVCSVRAKNPFGAKILTTWGFNKRSDGWVGAQVSN